MNVLAKMFVPSDILEDFKVSDAYQENGVWIITLHEKDDLTQLPKQIKYKAKAVLNGYCAPIDIQTFRCRVF